MSVQEVSDFMNEFLGLVHLSTDDVGRILFTHNAAQHYLVKYVRAKNPNLPSLDDLRLGFTDILKLANLQDDILRDALSRLNRERNNLAHGRRVDLSAKGLEPILRYLKRDAPDVAKTEEGIELVSAFALFACSDLNTLANPVKTGLSIPTSEASNEVDR